MKIWRWEKGRQNTGYEKLFLLGSRWPIKFDCYMLKFNEGADIPPHVDKVDKGNHYRLNLILKQAKSGGAFHCKKCIYETKRIKLFRPDRYEHSVTKIKAGCRLVLSIGWVKNV